VPGSDRPHGLPERVIENAAERERPAEAGCPGRPYVTAATVFRLGQEIGFTNQLSYDVVPVSNTARFLILSAVIMLAATTLIIATKG
jgi:hypothetical protein